MAAWSGLLALSGFRFDGRTASVTALPRIGVSPFRCFWSSGTGWGSFTCSRAQTEVSVALRVLAGELPCQSCEMEGTGAKTSASLSGKPLPHKAERAGSHSIFRFSSLTLKEGDELRLRLYT
jgi:hypothetical protein